MTEYVIIAIVATATLVLTLVRLSLKTFVEESVKHEFEALRQTMREDFEREQNALDSQDRFRLAALDKRMEAHQEAFALGREMLPLVHSQTMEKLPLVEKCEKFWNESSLYLTADARESLHACKAIFRLLRYLSHGLEVGPKQRGASGRFGEGIQCNSRPPFQANRDY